MRRAPIVWTLLGGVVLAAVIALMAVPTTAQQNAPRRQAAAALPISQVVLFSSGVGFFLREGEIDGDGRVDLTFPAGNINDLLKSLVLQDLGGGKISTINYDSQDPIEKTLRSFALDLTSNPTFGQILNQARGEKVELILTGAQRGRQADTLTGTIVGMQSKTEPQGTDKTVEVEHLNLLADDGLRSVPLPQIQRVRFTNPVLDSEFKRALAVLAGSHDMQKKQVSLSFRGDGKRKVRVGYVVENPIWKTSYRLVLDKNDKAHLQGWAMVENTGDDDWSNVKMALISGRPISFEMNLYQPLYIPRPTVEPELFASLRPPSYNGAMTPSDGIPVASAGVSPPVPPLGGFAGGGGAMRGNAYQNAQPGNSIVGINGYAAGMQFPQTPQPYLNLLTPGNTAWSNTNPAWPSQGKLNFEQLQQHRQQLATGRPAAEARGPIDAKASISSAATGEDIGDYFEYVIDDKVSLPRQKSALLPIVTEDVQGEHVSIFNENVHAKFPLLGLKFKNTSKQHLMQGPITVYEGNTYVGDSRIMDLQPNEERLLSYAIDLGTEVKAEGQSRPSQLVAVKIVKGILQATHKLRETKTYLVKNRNDHDRKLIIEHPHRTEWKLMAPEKPSERSRDVYRFQVAVPAGKSIKQEVVEEQNRVTQFALTSIDDQAVRLYFTSNASGAKVKDALKEALERRTKLADSQRDLANVDKQLKAISEDQGRLRANLSHVPPTSAAYKRYLEKFDTQETEIEKLQGQIKQLQDSVKTQQKGYEDYLAALNVE